MPDYRESVQTAEVPLVAHEIGQWCSYPDRRRITDLTGFLKPRNYELIAELFDRSAVGLSYDAVYAASGRQQVLCYKEEIETALRTPGFGGFQLLALTDFPGQGTAPVGVLSYSWEPKGYIRAEEFRRFCAPIVVLARIPRRTLRVGDRLQVELELANYGPRELRDVTVSRRLRLGSSDELGPAVEAAAPRIPAGGLSPLARVDLEIPSEAADRQCVLEVHVEAEGRRVAENAWDLWVFPAAAQESPAVHAPRSAVVESVEDLASRADDLDRALLLAAPEAVRSEVKLGFSTVFWNTAWTGGQGPHTLGLVNDTDHPLFGHFPSGPYGDWHWWEILRYSAAMVLDGFPEDLRVPVAPIDTWFRMHRLGLVFEARLGSVSVLVCSCDFERDMDARPAAARFRDALISYLQSPEF
jgi:hypothetical protein